MGLTSTKVIYLAHPYGLKKENLDRANTLEQELLAQGLTVFNPVRYFTPYDRKYNHAEVMKYCLDILGNCQELYIAKGWEQSKGCVMEHEFAKKWGIPITYL